MSRTTKPAKRKTRQKSGLGGAVIESLSEAVAWARGEIALQVRESPPRSRRSGKGEPIAGERAAGLTFEGPGDLSTNPRHTAGYGQSKRSEPVSTLRASLVEPEALRMIGEESKRNGTDKLTAREIDREIAAARAKKPKRK